MPISLNSNNTLLEMKILCLQSLSDVRIGGPFSNEVSGKMVYTCAKRNMELRNI